ncbi:MAG: hypothetical protein HYX74_09740 [Acidobacteria bacterium]|nr:hypothetical protein [Acidobacteriota bacterium]
MYQVALMILISMYVSTTMAAQGGPPGPPDDRQEGPVQAGYAILTPTSPATDGLVVFETFGFRRGEESRQAGILPANMTSSAMLFVNAQGRLSRDVGVAVANPSNTDAHLTATLRGENGAVIATRNLTVEAGQQTARFVTEMFADRPEVPRDFTGSLTIASDIPVSMVGLRFRGINFSTLPLVTLAPAAQVPTRNDRPGVGGPGAILLPQFAAGGGWATEIVIVSSADAARTLRVDLFKQDGSPLAARLNGESKSTFTDLTIPARGVLVLSPRDGQGDSPF